MKNLLIASRIVFSILAIIIIAVAIFKEQYSLLILLPLLVIFYSVIYMLSKSNGFKS